MKILILNWRDLKHSWAGGGELYIFEQATRWIKMGHTVTVFCGEDREKNLPLFEVVHGVKIYRRGGRISVYFWAVWYYMFRFRRKFDVIIDAQNGIPFFTPLFSRTSKICFVHHIHGNQFFYELDFPLNYIGFLIERFIFPIIYRNVTIVAVSKTTKKNLIRIGFDSKKIKIIYNGIASLKNKSNTKVKKFSNPTILYLGRIKAYKRVDLLVKIFPSIINQVPNAHLIIAGWGTEASHLADLVMKHPERKKIKLVGPVSNVEKKQLFTKSWLFVNPSIGEGWSIAVIEANLYGTPAVSFNVPGLSESILHGKTGMLAKNEKDLINKICSILSNKDLREKLGINAKVYAEKFDWDKTASTNLHLLHALLKKK